MLTGLLLTLLALVGIIAIMVNFRKVKGRGAADRGEYRSIAAPLCQADIRKPI
jgi:hypothetical protein